MKFELTIKDCKTGEELVKESIDGIVGAIVRSVADDQVALRTITLVSGATLIAMQAARGAQMAASHIEKMVVDNFEKEHGFRVPYEEFARVMLDHSTNIEVDAKVIKKMMESNDNEI